MVWDVEQNTCRYETSEPLYHNVEYLNPKSLTILVDQDRKDSVTIRARNNLVVKNVKINATNTQNHRGMDIGKSLVVENVHTDAKTTLHLPWMDIGKDLVVENMYINAKTTLDQLDMQINGNLKVTGALNISANVKMSGNISVKDVIYIKEINIAENCSFGMSDWRC